MSTKFNDRGDQQLQETKSFWNNNPCDGQKNYFSRSAFRYKKEPWLLALLKSVSCHETILEIGCGQGTDAVTICTMKKSGTYIGIDLSDVSVCQARRAVEEFQNNNELIVVPDLLQGNAESLDFPDASFDCVYSLGVLHHTPNITQAIKEIRRVLKQGGVVYITLYNKFSVKLIVANTIRVLFSFIPGKEKILASLRRKNSSFWGTMLLECLGVPILHAYSYSEIKNLFKDFYNVSIARSGCGFPIAAKVFDKLSIAQYMFVVKCCKGIDS